MSSATARIPIAEEDRHDARPSCGGVQETFPREQARREQPPCASKGQDCAGASPMLPPTEGSAVPESSAATAVYHIANMDCPMEEALIRKRLGGLPGVTGLEFNLMRRVLTVHHELAATDGIEAALVSIGMPPEALRRDGGTDAPAGAAAPAPIPWGRLALAGLFALFAEAGDLALLPRWTPYGFPVTEHLPTGLALLAILLSGFTTYRKGWIAIRNLNLNINALMSVAVTGAALIGQWPEAAMVMVLFNVAEAIEARSLDRARNAIKSLLSLAPERATVRLPDGSWSEADIRQIAVGSRVRVRPGERVGLDGVIAEGRSAINQAPITGESLPVDKGRGDPVYAGTINESGSFEFIVSAAATDSTLARIIHAVEEAQGSRAPIQRFVDQFARVYTPAVFLAALLVALAPPLLLGGEWREWVYTALVLLVIGCPCALVISTPVSIVSGMAAATRRGILVKGGLFLEQGRKLAWLALDKTGTLTHGKPRLTDAVPLEASDGEACLTIAASLADRSDHPVSRAIAQAAAEKGASFLEVADFTALPGQGVSGVIAGERWRLGNRRLADELGRSSPELQERVAALEQQGKTVVLLMGDKGARGLFAVADTLKDSSIEAIRELRALGVKTMMLTGDNEHTAKAIAERVGVDAARGNLMPEDKLAIVASLSESESGSGTVGMVGDGINDAPALARADIGFAMGAAGTDSAIESADVALMDDDLRKIPAFIRLSRATYAILMQNIILAVGIKAVFFALTFAGQATMWMAVFADVGASLLVVANGLRAMRK